MHNIEIRSIIRTPGYFFVFFLFPPSFLSSFYTTTTRQSKKNLQRKNKHTFRFVPFSFPFPSPFPFPFFGEPSGLGLTVKKPSNLPCCLLFKYFWSFSAPFRTRSSLDIHNKPGKEGQRGSTYLKPFSSTRNFTSPSTSGFFHTSYD